MEFKRDNCTFIIPERPTVRQQMMWFSAVSGSDKTKSLERYWEGAKALIEKWESSALPDYKISLDAITDPSQTSIVIWAGIQVLDFMNGLEDIPKN